MRGAKEEEKVMSPMFPRLHVNDTEKGGPRAPPRNKMALYEQFSIPSQRNSLGSASALPLPTNNGSSLVPSMSTSHGGGHERSVFSPFCNSPAPSNFDGVKSDPVMANQEQKSVNSKNDLNTTQLLLSSAKSNSFQSHNFSNFKNFSWKKVGDESDFRVPTSVHSVVALHRSSSHHSKECENQPCFNLCTTIQFQDGFEKQRKGAGTVDLLAREGRRNQTEENVRVSQTPQDPMERSTSLGEAKDKISLNAATSPTSKVKSSESLKRAHPSSNQEYRSSSVDLLKSVHATNPWLNQDIVTTREKTVLRDVLDSTDGLSKEIGSKLRNESTYSRPLLGEDNRTPNLPENGSEFRGDKKCGSLQVGDVGRHYDVSETSMVDSLYAVDITPDDVVGVLGEKQFWDARTAIVNQQRVFAVQVFELHRLIKVQQWIAGKPNLLLEDSLYMGKSSLKLSPGKMLRSEHSVGQLPIVVKSKRLPLKPKASAEIADENAVEKLPLPSVNSDETSKGLFTQHTNYGSHSGAAPPAPIANNTKPSPWCFPPPGNQWLVPVMSPSEGLVYKPYTGPCPPAAGFMAQAFGSCGPMSLPPGSGEYLNAAYGVPASHHQGIGMIPGNPPLGQTYFPPYGMQVMNPSVSGSGVEQMSPFTGPKSQENPFSFGEINFTFPRQNSCNMSSQMSRAISNCVGKFQASKESEVQGSTASSPSERPKGDAALPLFPTEPTVQASDQKAQSNEELPTRVIKVVPHNPRTATESAARIFQCIQEERKHL